MERIAMLYGRHQYFMLVMLITLLITSTYLKPAIGADLVPGTVFIKFRTDQTIVTGTARTENAELNKFLEDNGIFKIEPLIRNKRYKTKLIKDAGVTRIYFAYFPEDHSPETVAERLSMHKEIEYAEPQYAYHFCATPNDSLYLDQQSKYFDLIQAREAWDIIRGEGSDIVVAVIDGGTDIRHEDLTDNIWINSDEIPDNGIDDDQNGYTDDYYGWNFQNNSGDPTGDPAVTPFNADHGTHVISKLRLCIFYFLMHTQSFCDCLR